VPDTVTSDTLRQSGCAAGETNAVLRIFLLLAVLLINACSGGSTSSTPTAPTPPVTTAPTTPTTPASAGPPTITITASGMSPLDITIAVGQRVTFINNDIRPHDVVGGADPSHPECPEIVQMGFLSAGQRGDTGVFTAAATCPYHDHTELGVPSFSGHIIIK
jgi:plastocyanin